METKYAMTRTELCALIRSRQQGITATIRLHYRSDATVRAPEVKADTAYKLATFIPLSHALAQEVVRRMITDDGEMAGLRIPVAIVGDGKQRVIWIG